jgi:putative membrane protein
MNKDSDHRAEEGADRRTVLAADRTIFAAERTYAAWVRTGLTALAACVGAKVGLGQVMAESVVLVAGSILVLFSAFCFGATVWRKLFPGPPPPRPDVQQLPPALLKGVSSVVAFCYFVVLCTRLQPASPHRPMLRGV